MLGYKLDFVRTNFKRSFQILNAFLLQRKALFFQKLNEPINYLHHFQFVSLNCLPNLIISYCKRFLEESPLIFFFRKIQDLLIQGNGTYYVDFFSCKCSIKVCKLLEEPLELSLLIDIKIRSNKQVMLKKNS